MTLVASLAATAPGRVHGGPDRLGVPLHDFSSNSNACGPCPQALAAVREADPRAYPDPSYADVRESLAGFHGVDAARIVLATSASEFIFRISSWVARQPSPSRAAARVWIPPNAYGDYAAAARAHGLALHSGPAGAQLRWSCDPSSPLGSAQPELALLAGDPHATTVLDLAYEPLRLEGALALTDAQLQTLWQLWTPNKALGLTGVRAAYAIAPEGRGGLAAAHALDQLCPSWPIGVHGVAMLQAWTRPEVRMWLATSLVLLREWKSRQLAIFASMGWPCESGQANFFCARPQLPAGLDLADALGRVRSQGIKLRDTSSFGLPGMVRASVQPPAAQDALCQAWQRMTRTGP